MLTLGSIQAARHKLIATCRHEACRYSREVDTERLIGRVGVREKPVPDRAGPHFTDAMRCPSCKRMGMNLCIIPVVDPPRIPNFRIVDQGISQPHGFDVIATADNLMVARGAYAAAALFYPDHWITLMQGAHVTADSREDGPPKVLTAEDYQKMREMERWVSSTKTD